MALDSTCRNASGPAGGRLGRSTLPRHRCRQQALRIVTQRPQRPRAIPFAINQSPGEPGPGPPRRGPRPHASRPHPQTAAGRLLTTDGPSGAPSNSTSTWKPTQGRPRRRAEASNGVASVSGTLSWRYRRRREYPQPPPPNTSTIKSRMSKVDICDAPFFGSAAKRVHLCVRPSCGSRGTLSW